MANIIWDEQEKRLFEKGLDRGVLYLSDSTGFPWNGLISIDESFDEALSETYLDGTKVSDLYSPSDFKATLTAFTYPDEFLPYQGVELFDSSGMSVTAQDFLTFGLSYRTLIGNDTLGLEYGYQIHILYNLTAVPQDLDYETYSSNPNVSNFKWSITSVPSPVEGFRPTVHVLIDSRFVVGYLMMFVEDTLYGFDRPEPIIKPAEIYTNDDLTPPILSADLNSDYDWYDYIEPADVRERSVSSTLPVLDDFTWVLRLFDPKSIVPNYDSGFSSLVTGYGDVTPSKIDGLFRKLPRTNLVPVFKDKYYVLETD